MTILCLSSGLGISPISTVRSCARARRVGGHRRIGRGPWLGVARAPQRRRSDSGDRWAARVERRRVTRPLDGGRDAEARVDRLRNSTGHSNALRAVGARMEMTVAGCRQRAAPFLRLAGVTGFAIVFACQAAMAAPQTAEERAAARLVVTQRAAAVVVVLATIKVRLNVSGREQTSDQAAQTNATILDPSGVAVMSLQQIQPDEAMTRMYSRQVPNGGHVEGTTEIAGIRVH